MPGLPAQIELTLSPTCILPDGRDLFTVGARVLDAAGSPVTDGTLVRFGWPGGQGTASTLHGEAALTLPAPTQPTLQRIMAQSGPARQAIVLRVVEESCGP
ncbi:MAG: hypothetical protein HC915_01500 [Anaerolineae bacterium]|nr:hypothetical protein [Anaerolineae bacterium]